MNMQRITISLPKYLYDHLIKRVPERGVSRFTAQALEKELMSQDEDPVEEFVKLRKKLPKKSKRTVMRAIRKGRV